MKRTRTILIAGLIGLAALIVIGRIMRQSRSEALREDLSDVISVQGIVVAPEVFTRQIEESGTLAGDKEAMVAFETGGRVLQLLVDIGDTVRQGDPLIRLDDELYRLESERAQVAAEKAAADLKRVEKLHAEKSVSDTDFEGASLMSKSADVQYRLALKTYRDATLRAPFSGTVAARFTEVGQMVERGMPALQLVDIHRLRLVVPVSEEDVQHVAVGDSATVLVPASGDTVHGEVIAVGSRATAGSRTFPLEIRLPGGPRLRSGMFARAFIAGMTAPGTLLLPRVAVLPDAGQTVVYRARAGRAEKVIVRLTGTSGDRVAVEGVAPGDTIITVGNQSVSHGSQINLALNAPVAP